MKAETMKSEILDDAERLQIGTEMAKVVTKAALHELCRATSMMTDDNKAVSVTTCMTLMLQQVTNMMVNTDRGAALEILQLMADALANGGISAEAGQAMIAAQQRMANREIAMVAKASAQGQA